MRYNSSVPKPALFVHIQKTAGSSIVDIARLAYGADQVVSHGDYAANSPNHTLSMVDELLDNSLESSPVKEMAARFQHISFVSGHFGFDFAKALMEERFSFTFLRNPVERILSYYYFCRTRDPKEFEIYSLAHELSLDNFLMLGLERPAIKIRIWNNQTFQLAAGYGGPNSSSVFNTPPQEILKLAIEHLDKFSYVGFAETFEKDRNSILTALGIAPPKEKVFTNANPGRPTAADLPASTRDILHELTHLDRALYQEAWSRKKSKNSFLRRLLGN